MIEFWNGLLTHQMTMKTSLLVVDIASSWHAVTEQVLKLSLVENGDGIQGNGMHWLVQCVWHLRSIKEITPRTMELSGQLKVKCEC